MIGADRHPAGVRGDVVDAVRLAHVIRYLDDAIDTDAQAWARQVADALRGAIHEVNSTRVDDQAAPDAGLLTRLRRRFDQGVAVGISTNLSRPWPRATIPACNWPNGSSARPTKCDFFLFPTEEPEATAERVVELVARRIPRRFAIPARDIQVLAPMHRGPAGAGTLNTLLQQALAPFSEGTPERRRRARVFRPGDKVIQIRDNYDKGAAGVFNGTVGTITALSVVDQQLTVRTDEDEDIDYDFDELDELDELQHAYAITVHRSQGSEYPAVVIPLTMSAYTLLQRDLLYTAVTRAKRLVVLAGSRKALAIAVGTAGTGRRHTALTHRLHTPATT
jgi:ATP-dependent exoDNAse (exonuclease V) alpha subunit